MTVYRASALREAIRNTLVDSPFLFCFDLAFIVFLIFYGYVIFDGITRKFFITVTVSTTVILGIFTNPNITFNILIYDVLIFAVACAVVERVIFHIRYSHLNREKKDNGSSILALDEFKDEVCVPEGENIAGINMTYAEIRKAQKAIVKLNRKDGYESEIRSANKIIDSFYVYSAKTKNDFVPKETYDNIKNMRKHLEKLVLNTKNKKEN